MKRVVASRDVRDAGAVAAGLVGWLRLPVLLAVALLLGACAPLEVVRLHGQTMGTTWSARVVVPARTDVDPLRERVQQRLDRVVGQMSTWEPDSDLSRFNRAPAGTWQALPPELLDVLDRALALARSTGGAYDPTIAPLVDLWGFGPPSQSHRIPDEAAIAAARERIGWRRIELDRGGSRALQPGGLHVDLSSIAKGFGVDEAARALDEASIGAYLVEVGGELRARGLRPDGHAWTVAVERPDAAPGAVGDDAQIQRRIELRDACIATSGDYRHSFEHAGRRYSHHIDPRSGWPGEHAIASVSVIADTCVEADPLGTALIVLGPVAGMAYARRHDLAVLFLLRDGDIVVERASPAFEALSGSTRE